MIEYGNGVGQATGQAGGSNGGQLDWGASIGQFLNDSAHTVSTLPPLTLAVIVVVLVLGLIALRRVF
ncbi:MAG: hypothetical protein E6I94_08420 [Chloroflexi bacterium]|nr:MAG: hypothetical protein E6I94_08420 [Chloroflexota bacterium]